MTKTEYEALIETVGEEYDLDISSSLSQKLSTRAEEVELENLLFDDIVDELMEIVPEDYREEDNWQDFINEIADAVFDNAEEETEDYGEYDEEDDE